MKPCSNTFIHKVNTNYFGQFSKGILIQSFVYKLLCCTMRVKEFFVFKGLITYILFTAAIL